MKVRKYNGKLKEFDENKIRYSIREAVKSTESDSMPDFTIEEIAQKVKSYVESLPDKSVTTYQISEMIEDLLMASPYKDTAKAYITYHKNRLDEHVSQSEIIKAFENKLKGSNIENSNANCDEKSFSGRMNEAARVLLKDNALKSMSKIFRDNHNNNEVYTHDLDSWSAGEHNCLSIPFDNLFKVGVHIKQTDIRPPKSISTAMQQIAVYMQIQSLQQFGLSI